MTGASSQATELREDLERIFVFMQAMSTGQATRHVTVSEGVQVVLNDDFPISHVQNTVNATRGASPDSVLAGLDVLVREARHPHINFWIDDQAALADQAEDDVAARGLKRENLEILVHSGDLDAASKPTALVAVVTGEDLDPVVRDGWLHDLPDASEETISQLVDRRTAYEAAIDTSYVAVRVDGTPVSRATLYRNGDIGQIEDVNTHPDHRSQGYAGACVLAGLSILRDQNCDLIFLESDADDWPRELYRGLGFTHLAPLPVFTGLE